MASLPKPTEDCCPAPPSTASLRFASQELQAFGSGASLLCRFLAVLPNPSSKMASTRVLAGAPLAVALLVLLQLGSPVEGGSDALAFVKETVAAHPLVIFSKSYCPYCKRAKSIFESMKETPFVIELDEREDGDDIQQALGKFISRRTVPQVFIYGEHIGGSDDTAAAQKSGLLKKLLKGSASAHKEQKWESEL